MVCSCSIHFEGSLSHSRNVIFHRQWFFLYTQTKRKFPWCSKREKEEEEKLLAQWPQLRHLLLNVVSLPDKHNLLGCTGASAQLPGIVLYISINSSGPKNESSCFVSFFFFCLWQCVLCVLLLKNQTIACDSLSSIWLHLRVEESCWVWWKEKLECIIFNLCSYNHHTQRDKWKSEWILLSDT